MKATLLFICGIFIGVFIGILLVALLTASKDRDE